MLIIFDVDGTLVDGEDADWKCFRAAATSVLKLTIPPDFVCDDDEVTAPALVQTLCRRTDIKPSREIEEAIRRAYLRNLTQCHRDNPDAFRAFKGAKTLFRTIKRLRFAKLGIISGDWLEAVLFKTAAAGININGIVLFTGSLRESRAAMLRRVVAATGSDASASVYIGDGSWDIRAAREVGMRFIGVGHRRAGLKAMGAASVLDDMRFQTVAKGIELSMSSQGQRV